MKRNSPLPVLLLFCVLPIVLPAAELSIEDIYGELDLSGPQPRELKFSPDGKRLSFLRGKIEDKDQLDLWQFKDGRESLLIDSQLLLPDEGELSQEEKDRRERQRIGAFSGIVEYFWSDENDALLFPLGGDIFLFDLNKPEKMAVTRLTETEAFETDIRFSPGGNYVSFIRDQDLFVIERGSGKEIRLTADGGGLIRNGMAEFVAQEEMRRYTGYWWSNDESQIAFTRVDETQVHVESRYEIEAGGVKVYQQRYPSAGTPNVKIALGVVPVIGGDPQWINLGDDQDIYLCRVAWLPDDQNLAVQIEPRSQDRLDLLLSDVKSGTTRVVLQEKSATWINLSNDLHFLKNGEEFIWTSERSSYRHLYLQSLDGTKPKQLTSGPWIVEEVLAVDEEKGEILFNGTLDGPLERHLYAVSYRDPGPPRRITKQRGWHSCTVDDTNTFFIDTWSDTDHPPQVSLRHADGTLVKELYPNRLDANHAYAPFAAHHLPTEFGTLKAEDGQTLHYGLIKPAHFDSSKKYPVMIYTYGGPGGQMVRNRWGRTSDLFKQWMAQRGYVVFMLDNRGTGHRGTAFDAPIHLRLGDIEVQDQAAGVRFLRQQAWVDADRVGIFGWSYGGYLTIMCLLREPDLFKAGVAVAPVTDYRLYDTHYTERYLGHPDTNGSGYDLSSVFPWLDQLQGPLLVMHGMADDNVLFTNTTRLMSELQQRDKAFSLMTYPGGKHSLTGNMIRRHVFKQMASFFDREFGVKRD